jgi:hypothetical protein
LPQVTSRLPPPIDQTESGKEKQQSRNDGAAACPREPTRQLTVPISTSHNQPPNSVRVRVPTYTIPAFYLLDVVCPTRTTRRGMAGSVKLCSHSSEFTRIPQSLAAALTRSLPRGQTASCTTSVGAYFVGATLSEAIGSAWSAYPSRLAYAMRIGQRTAVHLGTA